MHPSTSVFFLALAVIGGILLLGLKKRVLLRVALRNVVRRPTQAALVIAGLMVATSVISGSFILEDTFRAGITNTVYRALDGVDETIETSVTAGQDPTFPATVFQDLDRNRSSLPAIDGLAPRYQLTTAVLNKRTRIPETRVNVVGFDPNKEFAPFVLADGRTFSPATLSATEVVLDPDLADRTDSQIGDSLDVSLFNASNGQPESHPFRVRAILKDAGIGGWGSTFAPSSLFVRLEALQARMGTPDRLTVIVVSNVGDEVTGKGQTDAAIRQLSAHLPTGFVVDDIKRRFVNEAEQGADQLSTFFAVLGTFTIITGVMLVLNIFVMLAEERKGEMGVARALGMRRSHLVQSYVFEGLAYAVFSSAIGSLLGLVVAGAVIVGGNSVFGTGSSQFALSFRWESLLVGFSLGFFITLVTIVLASWRISNLNIVRAIRDIPEPKTRKTTRLDLAIGGFLAAAGISLTLLAVAQEDAFLILLGPCALALGLATLTYRRWNARIVFLATGLFILAWVLKPSRFYALEGAPWLMFISIGMLLILGGVIVVLANSQPLLRLLVKVPRSPSRVPVVRTAAAYPMHKGFRTGTTMGMIALVLFTMTVVAGFQFMFQTSVANFTEREGGGYGLLATTSYPMSQSTFESNLTAAGLRSRLAKYDALHQGYVSVSVPGKATDVVYPALGVSPGFALNTSYSFQSLLSPFTRELAWKAVVENESWAIIDGNAVPNDFAVGVGLIHAKVGDRFRLNTPSGPRNVTILGITNSLFTPALFLKESFVQGTLLSPGVTRFYFKPAASQNAEVLKQELERTYLPYAMSVLVIQETVDRALETTVQFINLLQGFIALGLVIGIAGLGVITMRSVVERRGETGALRAMGFQKGMILESFLLEVSLVALLGIGVGIVTGIFLTYNMWLDFLSEQGPFGVPWMTLAFFGVLAYVASLTTSLYPAYRASRLPPAEALRRVD